MDSDCSNNLDGRKKSTSINAESNPATAVGNDRPRTVRDVSAGEALEWWEPERVAALFRVTPGAGWGHHRCGACAERINPDWGLVTSDPRGRTRSVEIAEKQQTLGNIGVGGKNPGE